MAVRSLLLILPCVLSVGGCVVGLGPYADSSEDAPSGDVVIERLSPAVGPRRGGTEVTIEGEGFEGDVYVSFSSEPLNVRIVDSRTLIVESPRAPSAMTVDVTVTSDLGSAVAPSGFTYTENTTDDTGNPDDDTGTAPAVVPDGYLEISKLVTFCAACFGVTETANVAAYAAFHPYAAQGWRASMPALGTCGTTAERQPPGGLFTDVGTAITLGSGSTYINVPAVGGMEGVHYEAAPGENDFLPGASYDLTIGAGGEWGAHQAAAALATPQEFQAITPANLQIDYEPSAWSAAISRSGQSLGWGPSGTGGSVFIVLEILDSSHSIHRGTVACQAADTGAFNVPADVLSAYAVGDGVRVYLYRYIAGTFTLPEGGVGESVAMAGIGGTGVLR